MVLGLNNNLTNFVVREINNANVKAHGLGNSLTTGKNEFTTPVDSFLGNSLQDRNILLENLTKNLSYGVNTALIASKSLSSIALVLNKCLSVVTSAGVVSSNKLVVLQQNLNDKIKRINFLIKNTSFDGKILFQGVNLDMQIGTSITDKISMCIPNIDDILFRNETTKALNDYLGAELGRVGGYDTQKALDEAVQSKVNFTQKSEDDLGAQQLAAAIIAVRDKGDFFSRFDADILGINNFLDARYDTELRLRLNNILNIQPAVVDAVVEQIRRNIVPDITTIATEVERIGGVEVRDIFTTYGLHSTLQTADQEYIEIGLEDDEDRAQLINLLRDSQEISLETPAMRAEAQKILLSALSTIRVMQSDIENQKSNIIETSNALKISCNNLQQAADSYLKTDYVLTSQKLVEEIRSMTASITILQAGNVVREAILKLLDSLN